MLTLTEFFEFLKTPEAQALSTDEEKMEAAQAWKTKLDLANAPEVKEFDPVAHVAALKIERQEWVDRADLHPADRVAERLAHYDSEIAKYES